MTYGICYSMTFYEICDSMASKTLWNLMITDTVWHFRYLFQYDILDICFSMTSFYTCYSNVWHNICYSMTSFGICFSICSSLEDMEPVSSSASSSFSSSLWLDCASVAVDVAVATVEGKWCNTMKMLRLTAKEEHLPSFCLSW